MTEADSSNLRSALNEFVRFRTEVLRGDEKGEAQVFLDRLFRAFGHPGLHEAGAVLEMRLKKDSNKGTAFADLVWKPRCLIEMKKAGTDLSRHYRQAFGYWVQAVPNRPRYVVLCNFDEFWVYDFDNQMDAPVDCVKVTDLVTRYEALSFLLPEEVEPTFQNDLVAVTREAAAAVARVFTSMHDRGVPRDVAQRFVLQSVMAMFAEDIALLPSHLFTRALEDSLEAGDAYDLLFGLFREMNSPGVTPAGRYKGTKYFNGGLFSSVNAVELMRDELTLLHEASKTNWAAVRPEIFGTLFEGSMAEGERHAWGAHFTSQADIVKIVGPTIVEPWRERIEQAGSISELEQLLVEMLNFKVLDPACGSGNFLYVAYRELRRLEHEINARIAERRKSALTHQAAISYVSADHFYGLDINSFAVEIAKVTMMLAKKLSADELGDNFEVLPLDNLNDVILAKDALFNSWPSADVIIGNPPYLGRRKMVEKLGAEYANRLTTRYPNISGVSDFVCYWFPLAHDHLPAGGRAGFVATNSIREVSSRKVSLDYIVDRGGVIYNAVSSQPWSGDANVHVSIVNWAKDVDIPLKTLWLNDGELSMPLPVIPSSLEPVFDVKDAQSLLANKVPHVCFQGQTPGVTDGFVIDREARRELIEADENASEVIHPFLGGREMLRDGKVDRWVIDIYMNDAVEVEYRYPHVLERLRRLALPEREKAAAKEATNNRSLLLANPQAKPKKHHTNFLAHWWQLSYRRSDMLKAFRGISRYIATSRVASVNRDAVFEFLDLSIRPSDAMTVFALDDDYSLGILSSSLHQAWIVARCSRLKGDPRYTSTTVFDSFPWPQEPTEGRVREIANITGEIVALREQYLSQGMSLAKLYNTLRTPGENRLRSLHDTLNEAVWRAYGFNKDEDPVAQLFALNQDLANAPSSARGPGPGEYGGAWVSEYRRRP